MKGKALKKHNSTVSRASYDLLKFAYLFTGVQRRFRHHVPHSKYINCRSHRLALCIKHLIKDFPIIEEVDGLMLLIYKLFDNSPQKFTIFKDVQASYAVKKLSMVRASSTCWLSHGRARERIIERYVQVRGILFHVNCNLLRFNF